MLVSDIFTRVQRTFGDEASVQVIIDDVIRWINDAQREVVMQHPNLLQKVGYIDSVADQQAYDLPIDLFTLTDAYYRASSSSDKSYYELRYLSRPEMDEFVNGFSGPDYSSSTPLVFTRGDDEGKILIFPTPDVSYTQAIKLVYARYPVDVTANTDQLDIPAYYNNYVREYCLMKAYEMDEDWQASDHKASYVQGAMDFNNGRESWFGRDTYPVITTRWEDE